MYKKIKRTPKLPSQEILDKKILMTEYKHPQGDVYFLYESQVGQYGAYEEVIIQEFVDMKGVKFEEDEMSLKVWTVYVPKEGYEIKKL